MRVADECENVVARTIGQRESLVWGHGEKRWTSTDSATLGADSKDWREDILVRIHDEQAARREPGRNALGNKGAKGEAAGRGTRAGR